MTTREKCAHLLRRFGLGASQQELDACEKRGVNGTIDWLLDYDKEPETFNISPWSFAYDDKLKVNMDVGRFPAWWVNRMITTKRPLEQNLTLFWHNHFAVSGTKINFGPMMVDYIETLRKNATGNFRTLVGEIARDPAMVKWLDVDTNIKGAPNENFAREVMELFTLGIGNYTEKDIQEATRAFTGWSLRNALPDSNRIPQELQLQMAVAQDRPIIVFTDAPALHDRGDKTVLGKSGKFDADDVLDILVHQPAHAKFLATKLWKFYISPNPEPKQIEKLAKVYIDAKYEIKPVLMWMMKSKEFWSDPAQRAVVKSPAHYTISIIRQTDPTAALTTPDVEKTDPNGPVPKPLADFGVFTGVMRRQGMYLMFPPDVSGWEWGANWITTASIFERTKIGDYVLRRAGATGALLQRLQAAGVKDTNGIVDCLVKWFDVPVDEEKRKLLALALENNGGFTAFAKPQTALKPLTATFRLIAAIPEFQMC